MQAIRIPSKCIYSINDRSVNTNENTYANVTYPKPTDPDTPLQVITNTNSKTYSIESNSYKRSVAAFYTLNNWRNGKNYVKLQCQIGDYYTYEDVPQLAITTKKTKGNYTPAKSAFYPISLGGTYYKEPSDKYAPESGLYSYSIISSYYSIMEATDLVNEAEVHYTASNAGFSSTGGDEDYIAFYQSIAYKTAVFNDKQIESVTLPTYVVDHDILPIVGQAIPPIKAFETMETYSNVSDSDLKNAYNYLVYNPNGETPPSTYTNRWFIKSIEVADEVEYDDIMKKIRNGETIPNPEYDPNGGSTDNYQYGHIALTGCVVWYSNELQSKITYCAPVLLAFIKKRSSTAGNADIITWGLNKTCALVSVKLKNTYLPMTFNYGDRVIPYIHVPDKDDPTTGIDKPLAVNKDGTPIVYEVVSNSISFNGCVFQNLALQEVATDVVIIIYEESEAPTSWTDRLIYSQFCKIGETTQVGRNIIIGTDETKLTPWHNTGFSDDWIYPNGDSSSSGTRNKLKVYNYTTVSLSGVSEAGITLNYGQDIVFTNNNSADEPSINIQYKNENGLILSKPVKYYEHNNVKYIIMVPTS